MENKLSEQINLNQKLIDQTNSSKNENQTNESNQNEKSENLNKTENYEIYYQHFQQNKSLNNLNSSSDEDSCDISTWRDWISEMVIRRARFINGNIKQDQYNNLTCWMSEITQNGIITIKFSETIERPCFLEEKYKKRSLAETNEKEVKY